VALNGGVGAAPDGFAVLRLEVCSSTGPFLLPEGYAYTSPSTERTGFVRGEQPIAPVRYPCMGPATSYILYSPSCREGRSIAPVPPPTPPLPPVWRLS
jgi:hypothetical protein